MIKIDVRKALARGQFAGDIQTEFQADGSLLEIPYVEFSSPVAACLHYKIAGDDSVVITGEIRFSLKGACSRCLKETEQTFSGEVDARYVLRGAADEDYRYTGGVVDLSDCLKDAVMLALPMRLECGEDCSLPAWKES